MIMRQLILCISFFAGISCGHICREDGLFKNSIDSTSYFECLDGKATFIRCPINEDGLSYSVFNGEKCVNNRIVKRQQETNQVSCPSGSTYDRDTGRCRIVRFTDPKIVDSPDTDINQARPVPICPTGAAYDSRTGKCRVTEFFEPELRSQVISQVIVNNGCPVGYDYIAGLDKCRSIRYVEPITNYRPVVSRGGRYRRNGRFETILDNGQLVVETWYEKPWIWQNTGDQTKILL